MNYEIIKINDHTWRIENEGVRIFLLAGTKRALLIDSGMSLRNARDIAESLTDLPLSLLNTHADMDHTGSNGQFESFYMHPADEPDYRRGGHSGNVIPVEDGDELDLGERPLKIIHIPGHTPGSIAVLDVKNRVLISGDPVQQDGHIYMFGPNRNMDQYIKSLEYLESRADEFDEIWPSHADIPVSPEVIPKLREGARAVQAGEIEGKETEMHGFTVKVYDLGFCRLLGEA